MLSQSEIDHYHEAGYVIPDFRLPEEALEEIRAGHDRLLARHPEFRDYCSCLLQYDSGLSEPCPPPGDPRHGRAGAGAELRAVELELLRQARRQRQAHALASGRRVLADPAARDLHGVDRGRRRDARERLPAGDQGLAPGAPAAPPPDGRGGRGDADPGAAARGVRRAPGGRSRAGAGPGLAARRVPAARLGGQHLGAAAARHDACASCRPARCSTARSRPSCIGGSASPTIRCARSI